MKRWERGWFRRKKANVPEHEPSAASGQMTDVITEDWKVRYESEKAAHEAFRSEQERAVLHKQKAAAYCALLSECGIGQAKHDAILRLSDPDSIELDENGEPVGAEDIRAAIRKEWGELIPPLFSEQNPVLRGTSLTKSDILAIRDRNARRNAIAENIDLFR